MMNRKLQQIMAAKKTPKTEADEAGMNDLLARVRELRQQATKAQHEDVKNVAGVRQGGYAGFLAYSE